MGLKQLLVFLSLLCIFISKNWLRCLWIVQCIPFDAFWAVAPKGTKFCRTQGDFCSSVCLFVSPPRPSQTWNLPSQAWNLSSPAFNQPKSWEGRFKAWEGRFQTWEGKCQAWEGGYRARLLGSRGILLTGSLKHSITGQLLLCEGAFVYFSPFYWFSSI